jgi:WD40 repeat protein
MRCRAFVGLVGALALMAVGMPVHTRAQDPGSGPYREIMTLGKKPEWMPEFALRPDGEEIAADVIPIPGGGRDVFRVWDVMTGEMISEYETRDKTSGPISLQSIDWTPDGNLVWISAAASTVPWCGMELRDADTGLVLADVWEGLIGCRVSWKSDLSLIATTDSDGRTVMLINPATDQVLNQIDVGDATWPYPYLSPDGTRVALSVGTSGEIEIWDVENSDRVAVLEESNFFIYPISWSRDGSRIVGASRDEGLVLVWDASTGHVILRFEEHTERIVWVAWSPDGKELASVGNDAAFVWDAITGGVIAKLPGTPYSLGRIEWSSDGKLLAASNDIGTITIWGEG